MNWLRYKLLKWAVQVYCWPSRSGRVVVTFDVDRPFTLITGSATIPPVTKDAIDAHFVEHERTW